MGSVTFTLSNNVDLIIALSNISTNAPKVDNDILTAMFFDITPTLQQPLTPTSAMVTNGPGSEITGPMYFGNDTIVNGQWAYRGDLEPGSSKSKNAPPGTYGISSSSFSKLFGVSDLFSSAEVLNGTKPLSGVQFGLTDLVALSPNAASNLKKTDLIQNTIDIVIEGLPSGFTLSDIGDVSFEFGTSIKTGINIPGVLVGQIPEPSTIMLVAAGLLGAFTLTRAGTRSR
jgi:hypothetical protein